MASRAINTIRDIIADYEEFATQPEWFIYEREHDIILSLTTFADTATKLNNSDNYKPTDEEQDYWVHIIYDIDDFADKLFELTEDPQEYHSRGSLVLPLKSAIADLFGEFNGRVCENGEELFEEDGRAAYDGGVYYVVCMD